MRRRKREPAPPIFFPDVVTKELVDESEARALYDLFFSGCNLFVPLFDQTYDTFDDLRVRTPFTLDALLAIAAKVRAGPNPPGEVFRVCLAEAQGIARSTLFGPIVQKECVPDNFALSLRQQSKLTFRHLSFPAEPHKRSSSSRPTLRTRTSLPVMPSEQG